MSGTRKIFRFGKLEMGRRRVLQLAGGATVSLMAPMYWRKLSAQEKRIVVRDPGGPYTEAFTEVLHKPFKAATGIESVSVTSQLEPTTLIKSMVDTKTLNWDMLLVSRAAHDQLIAEGAYLDKLKFDSPFLRSLPAQYKAESFAGQDVYAAVLTYRKDAFKDKKPPQSWADFWNVKDFVGRRALRKHPFDTIEEALMADGVPPENVFPLDFDRAFRSLDKIKKHIAIWWTGGAQSSQLLKTGEVDLCPTWNGRAQVAIDEGAPVEIVWNQHIWNSSGWCIIKGTPKADMCREFIKFAVDPQRQAAMTKYVAHGPTQPDAYKFIDPARAKMLPTFPPNMKNAVEIDNTFWSKHKDKLIERMNAWLLS